tara:strand:- start:403 stop:645 length:243 start_codon:yes stop_codon:yes gene_type:complete
MKTFKDRIILTMVLGLFGLLSFLTLIDFYFSLVDNRPVDDSVVNLLQMALVGVIGIIAGYIAGGNNKTGCGNPNCKCGGA